MKTEDLITMLATGAGAAEAPAAAQRYALAIGWGAAGATLLMLALLQVRHDLGQALLLPMFWVKVGFVACVVSPRRTQVRRESGVSSDAAAIRRCGLPAESANESEHPSGRPKVRDR